MEPIIGCYWTLAGPYALGEDDFSPWDFALRAKAGAAAGYQGMGLKQSDIQQSLKRYSLTQMQDILQDNQLAYVELEVLVGWDGAKLERQRFEQDFSFLLEAADAFKAHHIKIVGDFKKTTGSITAMHDAIQPIVERMRTHQVRLALEPLAFSAISDVEVACAVLGETLGQGAGLMIDAWHVFCGRISLASLAKLPCGALVGVELDDGRFDLSADPLADTINKRYLPGEGSFDLNALIQTARSLGFKGPWGVEILSKQHRQRNLLEAAELSYQAARKLIG